MYDENGAPSDETIQDRNEHNDHADDAQDILDQERTEAEHDEAPGPARDAVNAAGCTTCGAPAGEPCHPVVQEQPSGPLIHYRDETVVPHPDRFHAAGQPCADQCDNCPPATPHDPEWSTPDGDGITVRFDGADDSLVVLWESGYTTAGTIRDLCEQLDREIDAGNVIDGVAAVYVRDFNTLALARVLFQHDAETITVEVIRDLPHASVIVAQGSFPGPIGWSTIRPPANDSATADRRYLD